MIQEGKRYDGRRPTWPITLFLSEEIADPALHDSFASEYHEMDRMPNSAVRLGEVKVEGLNSDWFQALAEAKRKAREIGGDALVLHYYHVYEPLEEDCPDRNTARFEVFRYGEH